MQEDGHPQPNVSPTHRLPTIFASQALQRQSTPRQQWVHTGLPKLDHLLRGSSTPDKDLLQNRSRGGYVKGQVTEVFGPPGSGKRALGLQAAVCALHRDETVVWIDSFYQLAAPRLKAVLPHVISKPSTASQSSSPATQSNDDLLKNFNHFSVPTLPHLLALVCHPTPGFPPNGTSLVVIDGVSNLLTAALPDKLDSTDKSWKKKDDAQWASNRRFSIMGDLLANLTKMAAIKNLAVLLLSQSGIRVKHDLGAILRPAISSKTWADNVSNRIIVFRDFCSVPARPTKQPDTGVRFVGIAKLNGLTRNRLFSVAPFTIDLTGIHELTTDAPAPITTLVSRSSPLKQHLQRKRKADEIADSESEDASSQNDDEFDWVEEDALALEESLDAGRGIEGNVRL